MEWVILPEQDTGREDLGGGVSETFPFSFNFLLTQGYSFGAR